MKHDLVWSYSFNLIGNFTANEEVIQPSLETDCQMWNNGEKVSGGDFIFGSRLYPLVQREKVCGNESSVCLWSSHKGREFMPVSFRPSEALWLMQSPTAIISHSFRPQGMNSLFRTKLTLVMIHVSLKKVVPSPAHIRGMFCLVGVTGNTICVNWLWNQSNNFNFSFYLICHIKLKLFKAMMF